MPPLISVIIPAHNAESTILPCIQSVLNQSYSHFEIICVNDSSSDRTLKHLETLKDNRIQIITVSARSASAARNIGLRSSRGEYLQFLDADDLLSANKFESQINRLLSSTGDAIGNCPWAHFVSEPSEAKWKRQSIDRDISTIDWLVKSWNGEGMSQTACWLTPRSLLEKAGKWNELLSRNPNDDGEFFCRVLATGNSIAFVDDTLVYYRKPSTPNVSFVKDSQQARSLLKSYIECENTIFQKEKSARTIVAAAQNYYRFIYQYQQSYPEVCELAWHRLSQLNYPRPMSLGSKSFRLLMRCIGFKNTTLLRSLLSRFLLSKSNQP